MKIVLAAFNGEPMCFVHVLLNAMDMKEKGHEVTIVIEGPATALAKDLHENPDKPFAPLYKKAKEQGLIGCACQACSQKTGALDSLKEQGIELCNEMNGHPSLARLMEEGHQVLTF
jgi:hypothetical protein